MVFNSPGAPTPSKEVRRLYKTFLDPGGRACEKSRLLHKTCIEPTRAAHKAPGRQRAPVNLTRYGKRTFHCGARTSAHKVGSCPGATRKRRARVRKKRAPHLAVLDRTARIKRTGGRVVGERRHANLDLALPPLLTQGGASHGRRSVWHDPAITTDAFRGPGAEFPPHSTRPSIHVKVCLKVSRDRIIPYAGLCKRCHFKVTAFNWKGIQVNVRSFIRAIRVIAKFYCYVYSKFVFLLLRRQTTCFHSVPSILTSPNFAFEK